METKTIDLSEKIKGLKKFIITPKGMKIVIIIGICAIGLIFVSNFFDTKKPAGKVQEKEISSEEYIESLEKRMGALVSSIEGVGKIKILITLENSAEKIYADEQKTNRDNSEDIDEQNATKKTQERQDSENKIVVVDNENGGREPLIKTQIEPRVKGVVIVCEGGDNELVKQRISACVTTALSIPIKKVCITKLS